MNLEIKFSSRWRWLTKISDPLFFQGKAEGQRSAVWIRARLQDQLSQLGYFLQRHAGKVLFLAIVALATFCVALKSAQIHSKVEQLWVQGEYVFWNISRKYKCIVIFSLNSANKVQKIFLFFLLFEKLIWSAKLNVRTILLKHIYFRSFKFINFFFLFVKRMK